MEAETAVRQIVRECGFNLRGPGSDYSVTNYRSKNILEIYGWLPDDTTATLGFLEIKGDIVIIYGKNPHDAVGKTILEISLCDPDSINKIKKELLILKEGTECSK